MIPLLAVFSYIRGKFNFSAAIPLGYDYPIWVLLICCWHALLQCFQKPAALWLFVYWTYLRPSLAKISFCLTVSCRFNRASSVSASSAIDTSASRAGGYQQNLAGICVPPDKTILTTLLNCCVELDFGMKPIAPSSILCAYGLGCAAEITMIGSSGWLVQSFAQKGQSRPCRHKQVNNGQPEINILCRQL